MKFARFIIGLIYFFSSTIALADAIIPMQLTSTGQNIGTVTIQETPKGLMFVPNLHHLPPGLHGFHVHEHSSCKHHAEAAGGHLDPYHTGKHLGPFNDKGHLGDLPVLQVDRAGKATKAVVAPRLKMKDVVDHSLMIHAGGDNYSDQPLKLGGGGSRIACGPIANHNRGQD